MCSLFRLREQVDILYIILKDEKIILYKQCLVNGIYIQHWLTLF